MKGPTIKFGPAGSDGLGYLKAVRKAARMRLDCIEVAFTYGVRMTPELAEAVGAAAAQKGLSLSVHAPYYVNLASEEKETLAASRRRLMAACRAAAILGAGKVVFHAGFYQGRPPRRTFARIASAVDALQAEIARAGLPVVLCPETTGKASQFGSLEEILELSRQTGCGLTVDFAHLLARAGGALDYGEVLDALPARFHAHFSGVEVGPKGERRHLPTTRGFFRPLANALAGRDCELSLVCESPRPYRDAAMMKRLMAGLLAGGAAGGRT